LKKLKVVALNDTMGAYHHFRLTCANDSLNCRAIQFSSIDHTNLWSASSENNKNITTLFKDKPITEVSKTEIKNRLFEVLEQIEPEVIILSGWDATPSLFALSWAMKYKTPTVIISESQEHDFKRNKIKEYFKSFLLSLVDSAFVGGINQRRYLVNLGFDNEIIFEGCDIVDNEFFMQPSDETDVENLKLPQKYFLTSCRFVKKKNLNILIDAFAALDRYYPEWSLVLAGDGPLREELESLVMKYNLSSKVYFLGYLDYLEMKHVYSTASCFGLPSTTEQWGLVINEALASGIPVICSENVGSAPNLLSGEHVGYTFNPKSSGDLLDKMKKIIADLKDTDFSSTTREVISRWDRDKYAKSLSNASHMAIERYKKRSFYKNLLLKLFILIKQ